MPVLLRRGVARAVPVGAIATICLTAVVAPLGAPAQAVGPPAAAAVAARESAGPLSDDEVRYFGGGRKLKAIAGGCQVSTVKYAELRMSSDVEDAKAKDVAVNQVPLAIKRSFAGLPLATDTATGRKAQDPKGPFNTADNVRLVNVTSTAMSASASNNPRVRIAVTQNAEGVSCRDLDAGLKSVQRALLAKEGTKKTSPALTAAGEIAATGIFIGAVLVSSSLGAAVMPMAGPYAAGSVAFVGSCIGGFAGRYMGAKLQGLDDQGALSAAGVSCLTAGTLGLGLGPFKQYLTNVIATRVAQTDYRIVWGDLAATEAARRVVEQAGPGAGLPA